MSVCCEAQVITTIAAPICTSAQKEEGNTFVDLRSFNGIAADGAGSVYVTEWNSGITLKMAEGADCLKKFADPGSLTASDRGSAVGASVLYPHGVAADRQGNIYVAQYHGCVVRKISKEGVSEIVAGNKLCGYNGEAVPATAGRMGNLNDVAIDERGNLFIADEFNRVVIKVTNDGYMLTYAGTTGAKGYSGDGGSALRARLQQPYAVAVGLNGELFISDPKANVVRKVDADGIITTYAGTGEKGYEGDKGPATAAKLHEPKGLAVDRDGNLYIADENNHVVRKVTSKGTISTFAGNGMAGSCRDGEPATSSSLTNPRDIAVDDNGSVYIIDFDKDVTHRIHKVLGPGVEEDIRISMGESAHYIKVDNCTYRSVVVLDAANKVVSEQDVTSRSFRISIEGLAPGNYTLDFRKKGHNKMVRFAVSEQ